jgi:hypothetical protein
MTSEKPKLPTHDAVKKVTEYRKSLRNQPISEKLRTALRNGKKKELENPAKKIAGSEPSSPQDVEL